MKKFYILKFNVLEDSYFAEQGYLSDDKLLDSFKEGESLKNEDLEIRLHKNKGTLLHHIENLYDIPVVSQKVVNVLKDISTDELEYYPVKIGHQTELKYYYIHTLNNVEAFDYEKSDYEELIPGIKILEAINTLVLNDEVLEKRNIFRLKGFKLRIIVSEKLKSELEKLKLNEFGFIPTQNYKWRLGKTDDDWF